MHEQVGVAVLSCALVSLMRLRWSFRDGIKINGVLVLVLLSDHDIVNVDWCVLCPLCHPAGKSSSRCLPFGLRLVFELLLLREQRVARRVFREEYRHLKVVWIEAIQSANAQCHRWPNSHPTCDTRDIYDSHVAVLLLDLPPNMSVHILRGRPPFVKDRSRQRTLPMF